jgi:hypothetical protein
MDIFNMNVNFFWSGDDFQFLNRLSILSHLNVGHHPIVWLYGLTPNSEYWIDDIPEIEIRNAQTICSIDGFIKQCKCSPDKAIRLASDYWRFNFLYEYGGLYCDTDAIALKPFPETDIFVSDDNNTNIAIGVINISPKSDLMKYCIDNVKPEWINVKMFTDGCKLFNIVQTHDWKVFYPWAWNDNFNLKNEFRLLWEEVIPDSISIHIFTTNISKLNFTHNLVINYPNSILFKLSKTIFNKYPMIKSDQKSRFTNIYNNNLFCGNESRSGLGSSLNQTEVIRIQIPKLLIDLNINIFIDAPCGDWNWMRLLDLSNLKYIGIDIVNDITTNNSIKYGSNNILFLNIDISNSDIPYGDLILCRDCFGHYTFDNIFKILEIFKRSKSKYLLMTDISNQKNNTELVGIWRPVNFRLPPFNFPKPIEIIFEGTFDTYDKYLSLWNINDLI